MLKKVNPCWILKKIHSTFVYHTEWLTAAITYKHISSFTVVTNQVSCLSKSYHLHSEDQNYASNTDLVSFHAVLFRSARYTFGNLVPAIWVAAWICAHCLLQQLLFFRRPRSWITPEVINLRLGSSCITFSNSCYLPNINMLLRLKYRSSIKLNVNNIHTHGSCSLPYTSWKTQS